MSNEHEEPLTWCERCRHWLPHECAQGNFHWPDFGDRCNEFERGAGVEG